MHNQIKIGFDLGNKSLKIAVRQKEGIDFHELILPEHLVEEDQVAMPHAFSALLKKTKKELHLPKGEAGLIMPPSQVICRKLTMPMMSVDQLMLNLPYEFSDFIQGKLQQYHCDYALCRENADEKEGEPQLTMMAAVAKRQHIQEYVRMFAAGGFSIKCILPQEMALIQLVQACRQAHPEGPDDFCFIDLGYLSTRVFVVQKDRIAATRRIPVGCRDVAGAVADMRNLEPFVADSYIRSNHNGVTEHPGCMEIYEQIAVEILKLINFYHFTNRTNQLDGVYLIGGGGKIEALCRILQDTLDLPALPVDTLLPEARGDDPSIGVCMYAAGLLAQIREEG